MTALLEATLLNAARHALWANTERHRARWLAAHRFLEAYGEEYEDVRRWRCQRMN